jgi:hypothetical protein
MAISSIASTADFLWTHFNLLKRNKSSQNAGIVNNDSDLKRSPSNLQGSQHAHSILISGTTVSGSSSEHSFYNFVFHDGFDDFGFEPSNKSLRALHYIIINNTV